jgi:hypothetical protein
LRFFNSRQDGESPILRSNPRCICALRILFICCVALLRLTLSSRSRSFFYGRGRGGETRRGFAFGKNEWIEMISSFPRGISLGDMQMQSEATA